MRAQAVDPTNPRSDCLDAAVDTLASGGILALPTETFYGLACDGLNADSLCRVNQIKGKPEDEPVLLLLADRGQAEAVVFDPPPEFAALAERFWPGPLTLVVRAAHDLPAQVGGRSGTVAVRVPGLALPRRIASQLGRPISGVSANRHGHQPFRTAAEVAATFTGEIELVLDGGPTTGGAPSTILDLTVPAPRVLREGLTPLSALRPFLPETV